MHRPSHAPLGRFTIRKFGLRPSNFGLRISDFGRFVGILVIAILAVIFPYAASASSSGALREYKAGKYDQSLKEYERLLERKDDPRLHFNTGAAAYRNEQYDEAAKQFDAALASPDLKLQQLAYYNRGNSLFWLGDQNPDATKKTENWQKALKDFESSMELNPQDSDAKFNHDLVKKRIEEFKQQQQQQSKQDKSDQDKNQDQQQSQQNQQSNQDKNQSQQNQQNQKQDSAQQNQQHQPPKSQDQQQPQQQTASQDKTNNPAQAASPDKKPDQPEDQNQEKGTAYAAAQMTPAQARQLLDAQKDDEQMLQLKPENKPIDHAQPLKDW